MKTNLITVLAGALLITGFITPETAFSQNTKEVVKKYMQELPAGRPDFKEGPQNYRMTAVYTNRDLYGNFTGKTFVTGDYTCGLENGMASWKNVFIAASNSFSDPFPEGVRQEYMENMKYLPTKGLLEEEAFKDFPSDLENVFARNLLWDMACIEGFAWEYSDSLQLNKNYTVPDIMGEFQMADIGTYNHTNIELCWTGISFMNGELCAVIEYRAIDNKISLEMEQMTTRGTEQYWGTTWISLDTRQIEYAEMYGGVIQEIELQGFQDKILAKTIRVLRVERIN